MQLILVINRRTRIEYYANKLITLISIKPFGLIVHGLCFLDVNLFAIECVYIYIYMSSNLRFKETAFMLRTDKLHSKYDTEVILRTDASTTCEKVIIRVKKLMVISRLYKVSGY